MKRKVVKLKDFKMVEIPMERFLAILDGDPQCLIHGETPSGKPRKPKQATVAQAE